MRYSQLIQIVKERKPSVVVEIGTWNGDRALEMFKVNPSMKYIGFDLFEQANPWTDAKEKNVKPHFVVEMVYDRLASAGLNTTLIQGNTNCTFTEWAENNPSSVDLVYIDGGHSIETIENDYQNALKVIRDGVIVFDDYYEGIPVDKHGANKVLESSGKEYTLLPLADPVYPEGIVKMAVMYP